MTVRSDCFVFAKWAGHTNFVTNTERCNLHKLIKKVSRQTPPPFIEYHVRVRRAQSSRFLAYEVSLNVLTGDTVLMKFSKEDESEAAMLQGNVSELLILVRKTEL